jgi:nicotinamide-nucleotide amidase
MQRKITQLTSHLGKKMTEMKLTLVTAESCSGGGLSHYISLNTESSPILERGYITYSNQAKEELLKVSTYSLQTHGAVSEEVAIEMATGALKNSCAQISIAITGIAGSDIEKGKERKNIGMVYICCASHSAKPMVHKIQISGSRTKFCHTLIIRSLTHIIHYLDKIPKLK